MNPRHRRPDPGPPEPDTTLLARARVGLLLTHQQLVMIWINAVAAVALFANAPGTSPSVQFLQATTVPLPVFGAAWLAVTLVLLAGVAGYPVQEYAHAAAFLLWSLTGAGTVRGLFTQATQAPSASLILAGLITGMAGWHVVALLFRRRVARLRRHP